MNNILLFLTIFIVFIGCRNPQKQSAEKATNLTQPVSEENDKDISEQFSQNCMIEIPSNNLKSIGEFLGRKDYRYTSKIENKDFSFSYRTNLKSKNSLTYVDSHYIEHSFKKVNSINGNYYPSFRIVEFCFDSKIDLDNYYDKIKLIISQQEKNYAYLLKDKNRLLYVQTGVNMFGFIIKDFKSEFENIIKNGN